jgi:hypothetical protein
MPAHDASLLETEASGVTGAAHAFAAMTAGLSPVKSPPESEWDCAPRRMASGTNGVWGRS